MIYPVFLCVVSIAASITRPGCHSHNTSSPTPVCSTVKYVIRTLGATLVSCEYSLTPSNRIELGKISF